MTLSPLPADQRQFNFFKPGDTIAPVEDLEDLVDTDEEAVAEGEE